MSANTHTNANAQTAARHAAHVAAYNMHIDAALAADWLEAHATDLYESETRDDRLMVYGAEYFVQSEVLDADDNVIEVVDEVAADINTDEMDWAERHGQYMVDDFAAHKPNRALVQQAVTAKGAPHVHPRHATPAHINLFHDALCDAAFWGFANTTGATYGPKRWTERETAALANRMHKIKHERAVFGIADIINTDAKAATVSRAAQYADKQDSARRAAKRAAKRAARFASKL